MKVSKNAYYHWTKRKDTIIIETPKMILKKRIKVIFEESREIYGSCRILKKKIEREGVVYCRLYIGFLMKEMGLRSVLRRKYIITTIVDIPFPIANNELSRDFTSFKLGEKWVSDITSICVNDD